MSASGLLQSPNQAVGRDSRSSSASSVASAVPLLIGLSAAVQRSKDVISPKVKSDELFLRFLASPQARQLVQQLIEQRNSTQPPELLLPSPSQYDVASPELLSPMRRSGSGAISPGKKGATDEKYAVSPRRLDYAGPSRAARGNASPPLSPTSKSTPGSRGKPARHASPHTPKSVFPRGTSTPSTPSSGFAPMGAFAPVAPPKGAGDHLIGSTSRIWRDGYLQRDSDAIETELKAIDQIFAAAGGEYLELSPQPAPVPEGAAVPPPPVDRMAQLLKLLGLPLSMRSIFVQRVVTATTDIPPMGSVSKKSVLAFYDMALKYASPSRRVFNTIRANPNKQSLTPGDWHPLVRTVADTHPGLAFLRDSGDFLPRYVETVIVRLFHGVRARTRVAFPFSSSVCDRKCHMPVASALLSQGMHTQAGGSCRRRWEMTFPRF